MPALPLPVVRACVHVQHLSCDMTSFRQIKDRIDNVGNIGYLAHRRKALQKLAGIICVHRRIDDPRSDGVEPYAFLRVLHGEAPRDRLESAFRDHGERSVNARDRMLNHGAGYTSYAPTTVLQQYLLDGKLRDIDIALQVRSGQLFEILYRVFRKRFREEDARVIDDTIYGTKSLYCRRSDLAGGRRVADVTSYHSQPIRRSEGGCCDVQRVANDVIATLDEGVRYASTNSLTRTGHNHRLAFCLHCFRGSFSFLRAACTSRKHRRGHR